MYAKYTDNVCKIVHIIWSCKVYESSAIKWNQVPFISFIATFAMVCLIFGMRLPESMIGLPKISIKHTHRNQNLTSIYVLAIYYAETFSQFYKYRICTKRNLNGSVYKMVRVANFFTIRCSVYVLYNRRVPKILTRSSSLQT